MREGNNRRRTGRVQTRAPKARLVLELLEDRSLLSASGLTGMPADAILVGGKDGGIQRIEIGEGITVEQALESYRASSDVAYAELDYQVHAAVLPNDTNFGLQYALRNTGQSGGTIDADIDADQAWDVTTGSTSTVVAIIDTGIDYTHPDLYLNIWINQGELPTNLGLVDTDGDGLITFRDLNASSNSGKVSDANSNGRIDGFDLLNSSQWENGVDNDSNGRTDDLIGWDFVNGDNDPFDDNGHGTHVAGTIGATGNNSIGVTGVAWNVQLVGLKFLSASGSGATSGAVAALNYAVGENIGISNNSWGGGGYSTSLYNAINASRNIGHVFVAAAGNNNTNNDSSPSYPASYNLDNILVVASTDRNDVRSSFSNYGATSVDLAAPGSSILSTYPNNSYAYLSGTSMATPHVTGVAALLRSLDADLTYSEVINSIKQNVDAVSGLSGVVATGGRLNAFKAVSSIVGDSTGPRVVSAVASGTASVSSVRLTFNEAIDPNTFDASDITNFAGPNGTITVLGVSAFGTSNTVFDVTFATQTAGGTYSFGVGPNITDAAGNAMDQNQNGVLGEAADKYTVTFGVTSTQTYATTTPVNIYDKYTSISSIFVGQHVTVADLNVRLNITHTWDSDLYVVLRHATSGRSIVLSNFRGGSGDNFSNTTFDDEAGTAIANGAAPFAGTYRPDGSLSTFDGFDAYGTWQLRVTDYYYGDTGRINSWSLTLTPSNGGASAKSVVEDGEPAGEKVVSPSSPVAGTPSASSPIVAQQDVSASLLLGQPSPQVAGPTGSVVVVVQNFHHAAPVSFTSVSVASQDSTNALDLFFSSLDQDEDGESDDVLGGEEYLVFGGLSV